MSAPFFVGQVLKDPVEAGPLLTLFMSIYFPDSKLRWYSNSYWFVRNGETTPSKGMPCLGNYPITVAKLPPEIGGEQVQSIHDLAKYNHIRVHRSAHPDSVCNEHYKTVEWSSQDVEDVLRAFANGCPVYGYRITNAQGRAQKQDCYSGPVE